MSKRIVILGSKGMLGQTVSKYFSLDNEIIPFDKRYSPYERQEFLTMLNALEPEVIINCIGKIKQKTSKFEDLFVANSLLPLELNAAFTDTVIIHPSTDCVFSGEQNDTYGVLDFPNAHDDYGISKIYGELSGISRAKTFILRTSIIGLTRGYKSEGLLDWFMRQKNTTTISGFTNHLWNGITTLEWCRLAQSIILGTLPASQNGIIQVGAHKAISKYELLMCANEIFSKNIDIKPFAAPSSVSRVLEPEVRIDSVSSQLKRYWDWLNF